MTPNLSERHSLPKGSPPLPLNKELLCSNRLQTDRTPEKPTFERWETGRWSRETIHRHQRGGNLNGLPTYFGSQLCALHVVSQ